MTAKEFSEALGHYFNIRVTKENEQWIEKQLIKYAEAQPKEKEFIKVPILRK